MGTKDIMKSFLSLQEPGIQGMKCEKNAHSANSMLLIAMKYFMKVTNALGVIRMAMLL